MLATNYRGKRRIRMDKDAPIPEIQHPQDAIIKVGDHVVVPFNISCGECIFCEQELYSSCYESNRANSPIL